MYMKIKKKGNIIKLYNSIEFRQMRKLVEEEIDLINIKSDENEDIIYELDDIINSHNIQINIINKERLELKDKINSLKKEIKLIGNNNELLLKKINILKKKFNDMETDNERIINSSKQQILLIGKEIEKKRIDNEKEINLIKDRALERINGLINNFKGLKSLNNKDVKKLKFYLKTKIEKISYNNIKKLKLPRKQYKLIDRVSLIICITILVIIFIFMII